MREFLSENESFKNTDVAALYLRLSKEDIDKMNGGDDSESIKNQRILLTDEALKRGFMIADVYSDDDYSGTDSERPAFKRLIEDAKLKKFNVILCKSQSRFTRDMETAEKYINRIFPLLGIRFISIVDNIDTNIKGNKKARQINALINEWYVEDLSDNIRSVFRAKMQQGQFLGSFASYGYKRDENDRHKIVIDKESARVVQKIFDYYCEGYGVKAICDKLYEEQIPTPSEYKNDCGLNYKTPYSGRYKVRCLWGTTTIKRILKNETYIGTLIQGREKKVSYKSKKVIITPREEWVIKKNNHEPIISYEQFYKVQEMQRLRRRFSKKSDKGKQYPLAGKVFCKDCGSSMVRSGTKESGDNYLRCRLSSKTASKECTGHTISYFSLEKTILGELKKHIGEYMSNQDNFNAVEEEIKLQNNTLSNEENKRNELLSEQERLNEGIKKLYMDKYIGSITEDIFYSLRDNFEKKIKNNKGEIEFIENKIGFIKNTEKKEDKYKKIIEKCTNFEKLTTETVLDFIDYVEICEKDKNKNQKVIIHWKF